VLQTQQTANLALVYLGQGPENPFSGLTLFQGKSINKVMPYDTVRLCKTFNRVTTTYRIDKFINSPSYR
jgi:hypothetical protein